MLGSTRPKREAGGESTAERHHKLARLGKSSFVSQSGISHLIKAIKEEGIPDASSRITQYRARKAVCNSQTPYGTLVQRVQATMKNGEPMDLAVQHPLATLAYNALHSDDYSLVLRDALRKHPPSPAALWHLIIYQDGVNPSDGLSKNTSRKQCVFYASFLEFGLAALAHEEMWCTPIVLRSAQVNRLRGGCVQLADIVLTQFFNPMGTDIRRSGVTLQLKGSDERVTLFAKVSIILCDEPALKEILANKGHAGSKPCVLCLNAVLHKQPGGGEPYQANSEYAVSIADRDFAKCKLHTDDSLRLAVQKIHDYKGVVSNERFELLESIYGFNFNEYSIVLNNRYSIGVASSVMYDWAHGYICDGVADSEFGSFMQNMHRNSRTQYSELATYMSTWTFPKSTPSPMHLFHEDTYKRSIKTGTFSSSASEFLTVSPVLLRFLMAVCEPRGELMPFVASMTAVLKVLEVLQATKKGVVLPEHLRDVIETHFGKFLDAYGPDKIKPKHHYNRHLPALLASFGVLISTLVHERKHRLIKRYATRKNLKSYEVGMIEEITSHMLWDTQEGFLNSKRTAKPTRMQTYTLTELFPNASVDTFRMHSKINIKNASACAGDVVCFLTTDGERCVGELAATVSFTVGGAHQEWCAVTRWVKDSTPSEDTRWENWLTSSDHTLVESGRLEFACTCRFSTRGCQCLVYIPWEYR